jgi:hypothetical protein
MSRLIESGLLTLVVDTPYVYVEELMCAGGDERI